MKASHLNQNNKKVTTLHSSARQPRKRFTFRLTTCLLIFMLIYFSALFVTQYVRLLQLRHTLRDLEQSIEIVREQNMDMLAEMERLQSPAYLEQIARQDLGMVKPGELLFFFREPDKNETD